MIRNLQVWSIFGALVCLAFIAMFFVSRSNIVIERSRIAAETRAVRSRMEARQDQQKAFAVRQIDQLMVRLISIEAQRPVAAFELADDKLADDGADELPAVDDPIKPWGQWQDNGFIKAAFVWPANGSPITIWSLDGKEINQWLPDVVKYDWQDWFSARQNAQSSGWVAEPELIYAVNHQLRLVLQSGGLDNGPAAEDDANQLTVAGESVIETLASDAEMVGPICPVWLQDQLCMIRRVEDSSGVTLQGCMLNWQRLRVSLLRDLQGDFEGTPVLAPVFDLYPASESSSYSLWFPAKLDLIQRETPSVPYPSDGGWVLLGLGWLFLAITCGAVGLLLQTVLRMSNRREAFVSSVTHELRTPLTTFRLYADLLAKSPDPDKTKVYAKTLQTEAERLSHLVENVLCYSRMEKRGITSHHRVSQIGEMLDAMVPRLEEHCFRSGMILDFADAKPAIRKREVLTDPSAVDRILVNLVDNACKYGKTDESQVIQLAVDQSDRWLVFEVADHGPGLAKNQRRRLFKAYNHGQIGAESPNTTIGLGLNICFNLAKALGGVLSFEDNEPGCRFILKIPLDLRSR